MPHKYRVDNVIICDDIRTETSGKQILIGVYTDILVFSVLPTQVFRLFFRIQISTFGSTFSKMKFVIKNPSNDVAAAVEGDMPPYDPTEPVVVNMAAPGMILGAGLYTVELGLDQEPTKIYEFTVRAPKNEEEKQRLPHS